MCFQQYFYNQNYNMPINMMNQNNIHNFCSNNNQMNMMNQYNNNFIPNQNNMNMMMNNNNNYAMTLQYLNNMINNNLTNMFNNMNIDMNNNMGNAGFNNMYNNMQNWAGIENNVNGFNNNSQMFLMKNIFENLKFEEDPYKIQKGIAICLNNNTSDKNNVLGGNSLFTTSTNDDNFKNNNNDSKDIINIIFISMKGHTHNRKYNKNEKIRDIFESFLKEFGLPKNALKEIHFLYNAVNLNNLKENVTLKQFNIVNFARINIIDMKNIIAA